MTSPLTSVSTTLVFSRSTVSESSVPSMRRMPLFRVTPASNFRASSCSIIGGYLRLRKTVVTCCPAGCQNVLNIKHDLFSLSRQVLPRVLCATPHDPSGGTNPEGFHAYRQQ